jgi:flagellar biosynthesis/type III secretory pathway chaperone
MDQKFSGQIDGETREDPGSLYGRLLANLDRELSVQGSILQILGEEKVALTMASTEAILETNARKEATLLKAKGIAAERHGIIERFRSIPLWRGKKLNLSRLVELAPDAVTAGALRARQHALTTLADTIRTHNRRNTELVHAALEDIQGSLHLIRSMFSPGANYQKTGQLNLNSAQGSLINREG